MRRALVAALLVASATASADQAAAEDPKVANRALIHLDLGVYGRERTGHPCDDN